ncbi:hypothetical protein [Paenibacillus lautus]|uniref:hypothetical protein n=1 Tax=Paenibacillus lautus TaxID=1401 RepID=UPI001C7CCA62|nr:hypothetical protein [Paenibacillus lautus]MBX4150746.1 hypothetical protein [Paenibacillus lautus]
MMNNGVVELVTNEQMDNIMNLKADVEAWVFDSFDKVGCISRFDDDVVVMGNDYYMREHCRFIART